VRDIIAARYGKDWVVKRVVGLPGEEVEVKKGLCSSMVLHDRKNARFKKAHLISPMADCWMAILPPSVTTGQSLPFSPFTESCPEMKCVEK